jgi:hypothetical protein
MANGFLKLHRVKFLNMMISLNRRYREVWILVQFLHIDLYKPLITKAVSTLREVLVCSATYETSTQTE